MIDFKMTREQRMALLDSAYKNADSFTASECVELLRLHFTPGERTLASYACEPFQFSQDPRELEAQSLRALRAQLKEASRKKYLQLAVEHLGPLKLDDLTKPEA